MAGRKAPGRGPLGPAIRTLGRGLAVLEAVADSATGVGVTEVATIVGVDKGTASRLLASLRQAGYVRQGPDRRFALGSKVGWLARRYGSREDELVRASHSHLQALRDLTQETVHLAIVEGMDVAYILQEVPDRAVRAHWAVGTSLPLYRTAMGRAVIADLDGTSREQAIEAVRSDARARGEEDRLAAFTADIAAAEDRGWAAIDRNDEVTRIAASVRGEGGEPVAAITLSGPTYRMQQNVASISRQVVATAAAISAELTDSDGASEESAL